LEGADIRASFLDRLPGIRKNHYRYFPLFPFAIRSFNLDEYGLVVSSHYAVAQRVRPAPGARHISYVHTPLRYLWQAAGDRPGVGNGAIARWGRSIDRAAARRVDAFAANSRWIAGVIALAYGRESVVIHPPVDVHRFTAGMERGAEFLCVSRLAAHKRLEIVVEAFNRTGLPLAVVGEGPEGKRLEALAGPNIRFLGRRSDAEAAGLLAHARAFVHMAAEDFGIAVVEAQAAGCPVIAYAGGANVETVLDGETGLLVPEQTVEALVDGIMIFQREEKRFDPDRLREHAQQFDIAVFREAFGRFLDSKTPSGSISR
jgi:glycosyltransferase involved in cell wall biosynthesis